MLTQKTQDQLQVMKLHGMAQARDEQRPQPRAADLSFDERFGLLVERQWRWREDRALATRLHYAHLKQVACLEDLDFRHPRGLRRGLIDQLASGDWIRQHRNCLITGPTGVGTSYLGCALAQQACRLGFRTRYYKPHPEQGYRACLGLMRLGRTYGPARLEAACQRALALEACTYRHLQSMLAAKLEQQPLPGPEEPLPPPPPHANLCGQTYYQQPRTTLLHPGEPTSC